MPNPTPDKVPTIIDSATRTERPMTADEQKRVRDHLVLQSFKNRFDVQLSSMPQEKELF